MGEYRYISLREKPELKTAAADWFHSKWGVPTEAYLECMNEYLDHNKEYGWYLCLEGDQIVAGMGVIENDFHDRKDLNTIIDVSVHMNEDQVAEAETAGYDF